MMDERTRKDVLSRLSRIAGQIQGLRRMVENDQYCVDILLQISAVQAALGKVGGKVLARHIESCVAEALSSGNEAERRRKIDELMEVFYRYGHLKGKTAR